MGELRKPPGVHLVGSIPLNSTSAVFETAVRALPDRLSSLPDGETGSRSYFIAWQRSTLPTGILQQRSGGPPPEERRAFNYSLSDFKATHYDEHAIESYATFREMQDLGAIPKNVRFQVSLPSPVTVIRLFCATEYCEQAETLYEKKILEALRHIQDSIPGHQLVIQWDIPIEIGMLEYDAGRLQDPYFESYFSPVKPGILERLGRLVAAVDADVELGFHLCYGDIGHTHFIQPEDLGLLVDLANNITENIAPAHTIKYMHMPVPKDRDDEQFFKPLANLKLGGTKLFLGLIHAGDEDGTKKKIAAAQAVYSGELGVATECGLGRTSVELLENILEISASVTSPTENMEQRQSL